MFKEKKLFILEEPFANKPFGEKFLASREEFLRTPDIIVFYEKGTADKQSALFKFLKAQAKWQEFNLLNSSRLRKWAEKEISRLGAKINPSALNKLVDFVGQDLWRLSNEIKKLVAYAYRGGYGGSSPVRDTEDDPRSTIITIEDIEVLVKPRLQTDIFKTIDALAAKNKKLALCLLRGHLAKGDSAPYLLAMIAYQFRNLLIIKELCEKLVPYYFLAKKSKLHPFVVQKSYEQASRFTLAELKKIYQKLLDTDLQIKTGKIEPELGLDLLVAEI